MIVDCDKEGKDCLYSRTFSDTVKHFCDYFSVTGKLRKCPANACDKYEKCTNKAVAKRNKKRTLVKKGRKPLV